MKFKEIYYNVRWYVFTALALFFTLFIIRLFIIRQDVNIFCIVVGSWAFIEHSIYIFEKRKKKTT